MDLWSSTEKVFVHSAICIRLVLELIAHLLKLLEHPFMYDEKKTNKKNAITETILRLMEMRPT